jgi:hypothetical protein
MIVRVASTSGIELLAFPILPGAAVISTPPLIDLVPTPDDFYPGMVHGVIVHSGQTLVLVNIQTIAESGAAPCSAVSPISIQMYS